MKEYPHLAEMGIVKFEKIKKYMVTGVSTYDVLRFVYYRRTGSLLPASRSYKFPRVQKTVTTDSDARKTDTVMEMDTALRSALGELQDLRDANHHKRDLAESHLDELRLLDGDIALRSACIKKLVQKIQVRH